MPANLDNVRHILLTGRPGIGKTTLVIKVCELLTNLKLPVTGFYTKELRSGNSRTGFDVFSLDNKQGPLARITSGNQSNLQRKQYVPRVGNYEVDLVSFESIALPSLQIETNKSIIVIDEIGKMELFSKQFEKDVNSLFQNKDIIILATVPNRCNIMFIENLKKLHTATLIEVDFNNRDDLPNKIAQCVSNTYSHLRNVAVH